MRFRGDGLSIRSFLPGQESMFTLEHRSADFELPSQLNMGASYRFIFNDVHSLVHLCPQPQRDPPPDR